jgi:hypothetical protein
MAKHLWKFTFVEQNPYNKLDPTDPEAAYSIHVIDENEANRHIFTSFDEQYWELEMLFPRFNVKTPGELVGLNFASDHSVSTALDEMRMQILNQGYIFPADEKQILETLIKAFSKMQCPDLSSFNQETVKRTLHRVWGNDYKANSKWMRRFKRTIHRRSKGLVSLKRANKKAFPPHSRIYAYEFLVLAKGTKIQLMTMAPYADPIVTFYKNQ